MPKLPFVSKTNTPSSGELEQLSRGAYRLAIHGPASNPDLMIVASRLPQAVICLVSALSFHELTTQVLTPFPLH